LKNGIEVYSNDENSKKADYPSPRLKEMPKEDQSFLAIDPKIFLKTAISA
jgi:hypothetical protein